jgi:hypothetical protein
MRTKLTESSPGAALARLLDALERELIDASDEEILEAAKDLGMNPMMKGSAAFVGLNFSAKATMADFFGPDILRNAFIEAAQVTAATQLQPKRKVRRAKREPPAERKGWGEK